MGRAMESTQGAETPTATPSSDVLLALPPQGLDLRQLEIDLVRQALKMTHGNKTAAAALLGLNRDQMRYRVKKYKLERTKAS